MSTVVAEPLYLKRVTSKPSPGNPSAHPQRMVSVNAVLGVSLWILLWLGYNTDIARATQPGFPTDALDFIHGVRAFSPMLAGWIALLMIFVRSSRLLPWIMGSLGMMLLYAFIGITSSATVSIDPSDALYYGVNYLAIVLVLLAIVLVDDPLPDILKVLKLTWIVGTLIALSLLGAIPMLGSGLMVDTDISQVGMGAYGKVGTVIGMVSTRNTGFARYAAISGLVALAGILRKRGPIVRTIWGLVFALSMYALYIANGRTETMAFLGSAALILGAEKARRFINFLAAVGAAILLGLQGFYSGFFLYFTRTGHFDFTMTGRTRTWTEGWDLLWQSPWVGYGFQADRFYLRQHMHNAILQVFVQAGFLGGGAILIALAIAWLYLIKHFFLHKPADRSLIPPEIPAVFLFVTLSSVTESTFAFYSAAWLLSAPIVAYAIALDRHVRQSSAAVAREKRQRIRFGRRQIREANSTAI